MAVNGTTAPRPKAYSYARISTKKQVRGDGLRRQLEASARYAAEHGLELQEDTFEDWGVSAFDASNATRGKLAAFVGAVKSGRIRPGCFLLVENLDRLSRSQASVAYNLLVEIVELGVKVVTLSDGRVYDRESLNSDTIALMLAILSFARANEESEIKSKRVAAAHQRKRALRDPFAFGQGPGWLRPNADKTGWEPIPERVESVRKVFELAAAGFGAKYIARRANAEGWPVPGRARSWHATLPHKLVHNRRVLGEFEPSRLVRGKRVPTGEVWEGYYPQIVSAELFYAAAAASARRQNLPKRRDSTYRNIFQGLLRCGSCGATLARKSKTGPKNSDGYAIYVCSSRDRGVTQCENWNARELESFLLPSAMHFVAAEVLSDAAASQARANVENAEAAQRADKEALEALVDLVQSAAVPVTTALERVETLQRRIDERERELVQLRVLARDITTGWGEEEIEQAVTKALAALGDPGPAKAAEREALHQTLLRHVERINVWPRKKATLKLRSKQEPILVPFSAGEVLEALSRASDAETVLGRWLQQRSGEGTGKAASAALPQGKVAGQRNLSGIITV